MWIVTAYQSYCWSYHDLSVFLTLCQICPHRCTIGTIDTMKFENLNLDMFGLVWLGLGEFGAKMLKLHRKMQWSWKESKWSWKNHICPYCDCNACIFNKNRSYGLERVPRSSPFCHVLAILSKNGWKMQGIWRIWLPTVGHTLAMTHVYNVKYTSLRLNGLQIYPVCVHSPLPDPWLSWALIEPVVCTKILSSCSYPPGQWCNCEHWKMAFLFSFSLTGHSLLVPSEEQVQHCHHVSYTNKLYFGVYSWHVGKAVYCCARAVQ